VVRTVDEKDFLSALIEEGERVITETADDLISGSPSLPTDKRV
jgi:hypothetical protein